MFQVSHTGSTLDAPHAGTTQKIDIYVNKSNRKFRLLIRFVEGIDRFIGIGSRLSIKKCVVKQIICMPQQEHGKSALDPIGVHQIEAEPKVKGPLV